MSYFVNNVSINIIFVFIVVFVFLIRININIDPQRLVVQDDGCGMDKVAIQRLSTLYSVPYAGDRIGKFEEMVERSTGNN